MILARLFGRTIYAGSDRFRQPFVAVARTAPPNCVSGPELRATWAYDACLFRVWRWGARFGRVTFEYI